MPPQADTVFYSVIKYGKFALLSMLLILSFINGHKEYICENPRKFMWDSFLVGLTSAIGISIIASMRGYSDLIPNLAFISFFLFFTYNVFRELSGFNALTDEDKLTQGEAKQVKVLSKPLMGIMAGGALLLIVLAIISHRGLEQGFGQLLKEALIFGFCTAVAEGIVAKNHHEPPKVIAMAFFGNFILFFVAHILLQYGGFYTHVFPETTTAGLKAHSE